LGLSVGRLKSYRDLVAWQKAMDLVILVYRVTESFPRREWYGLAAEMRRSSLSVPSNISEGHSQRRGAYRRHLWIALGSHSELATQAEAACRLQYVAAPDRHELEALLGEVGRLTQGLLNSINIPDP
jgi:four helix bundle protein